MNAYTPDALIAADIDAYLDQHANKSMLRFITCGSVDDGKSTLIGRLLYDSKQIFEDQLAALEADSKRVGTQGQAIDFALLVDGLAAEREQGITIDVAYRFFATEKRKFIVADTPGHEQYTRNMVTGASTADLAVILIDARKGVLTQTRRHTYLAHLIGIRQIVLAVNKMDLVGYDQATFDAIVADYRAFADVDRHRPLHRHPAVRADRRQYHRARRDAMPWYAGPTLIEHLETVPVDTDRGSGTAVPAAGAMGQPPQSRLPRLRRADRQRHRQARRRRSGSCPRAGPPPSRRIVTWTATRPRRVAGQSVTLTLADEVDCSRGDVIAAADAPPQVADQFHATIVWMSDVGAAAGPRLLAQARHPDRRRDGAAARPCRRRQHQAELSAKTLELNDIGVAEVYTDRADRLRAL